MRALAILGVALLTMSQAPAVVTVTDSPGGLVDDFTMQRYLWERAGVSVRIAGRCASACTIYTGMKNVCVEPGAYFEFHQGTKPVATYLMFKSMQPDMADFILNYGYELPVHHVVLTTGRDDRQESWHQDWLRLQGSDAVEYGWLKAC